jgi:hypothetical protein
VSRVRQSFDHRVAQDDYFARIKAVLLLVHEHEEAFRTAQANLDHARSAAVEAQCRMTVNPLGEALSCSRKLRIVAQQRSYAHMRPQPSVRICSVEARPSLTAAEVTMSLTTQIAEGSTMAAGTESEKRICGRAAHLLVVSNGYRATSRRTAPHLAKG